ncbi:MAG: ATP-dependent sacrificial sulfur transferase LarE [Candidatus Binatia bacterium]
MDDTTKLARLRDLLAELPSTLIAFSGGVDSTFLLRVAHEVLGQRCVALTTVSATTPAEDVTDARRFAAELGVTHVVLRTDELGIPGYADNPINRCYFCKGNLFALCATEAARLGLAAVLDGANVDDLGDHRPGLTAATEHGVRHPLVEAGFDKAAIRRVSHTLGIAAWDRPASPCLSSRFPYGTRITPDRLARVAAAESFLRALGLRDLRVRFHDSVARIEVSPAAMTALVAPGTREAVVAEFQRIGFHYVALDLGGFRSGSLNESLGHQTHAGPEEMIPPAPQLR